MGIACASCKTTDRPTGQIVGRHSEVSWFCRSCLFGALSLLPDERSPRLRAYLLLESAVEILDDSEDSIFLDEVESVRSAMDQVWMDLTDEERESLNARDKREVQR